MAIGFSHVSILNSATIKFYLTPAKFVEISLSELTLISFALGAAIVLVGTFFKDAASSAKQWKAKRILQKKENAYKKLDKARDLLYQNKLSAALETVDSALTVLAGNRDALSLRGKIQEKLGNQDEVINTITRIQSTRPSDVESRLLLSEAYEREGDLEKALSALSSIKKYEDYFPVMERLIELHMAKEEYQKAYELQKSLAKKRGKGSSLDRERLNSLRYKLARTAYDSGKMDDAEKILKELIKEEGEFTPTYILLNDIYLHKGNQDGAMDCLLEGYRKTGNPIHLIKLEDIAIEHERPARLLDIYSNIKNDFEGDFTLTIFYGKFLLRLEMVDEAMEQFLKAESIDGDNAAVHIFLAEAYRRRNRLQESVDEYTKAFAYKRRYLVPFVCSGCGEKIIRWKDYCETCKKWDAFSIDFGDTKELKRIREEALQKVPVPD